MTRDETVRERTVKRFLECEAKRAEARAAALAEGKPEDEASDIAHEAAKRHWNAWADGLLARRKALEERGAWAAKKTPWGTLEPENAETRAWMEEAEANFSRCLFLLTGGERTEEASGEDKEKSEAGEPPVKSIAIEGGAANFTGFVFPGPARFDSAAFSGPASFDSAAFTKSTSFREAEFGSEEKKTDADFTAIKVERAFDLAGARFSKVPSFCQADFKQAPDLDGVDFPLPPAEPSTSGDEDLIPKYRAIRRMAIQSADYDREQRAFKGEMRSRRWKIDKFWHPEGFFGWCYDWAADCGRSIIRPFAIWLLSVFVFAVLYLPHNYALERCVSGDGWMFWSALYISGRNATVVGGGGRSETAAQAYRCLFGADSAPLGVSSIETFAQAPLSAVLIFLFLLAVKNRFKIK